MRGRERMWANVSRFGLAKENKGMVAILVCGLFLESLTQTFVSPALPSIMADFNVSATTVQWLASGYSMVTASTVPLAAYLIGRFTTRQIFIACLCLFVAGSGIAAVAPLFPILFFGRLLQALCIGGAMPMVMTVVLLAFPENRRGIAIGAIGLIIGTAPAIGPALAGLVVDLIGWRWLFAMVGSLAAIILALSTFELKPFGEFPKVRFDVLSVVLTLCGMLPLIYGLSMVTSSSTPLLMVALIAVGILFLGLYARRQVRLPEPMLNVRILKNKSYAIAVICIMLTYSAFIGTGVVLPMFIQNAQGLTAADSGLAMLPGALIGAVFGFVGGGLFDRFGARKTILPGGFIMLCGAIALAFLRIDTPYLLVMGAYTLLAFAMQFTMTPLNTYGYNVLEARDIPHAQPLTSTSIHASSALGPAVLVSISAASLAIVPNANGAYQAYTGCHMAFIAAAVLLGAAFLLNLVFLKKGSESSESK